MGERGDQPEQARGLYSVHRRQEPHQEGHSSEPQGMWLSKLISGQL